ncbi:hypothetical protein GS421_13445 [Rhodococcus hoagii]|nr:hypothetical protein [Prescottella equi]
MITLTSREFDLLAYFMKNPFVIHSRQDLLERVGNGHTVIYPRSLYTTSEDCVRGLGNYPESKRYGGGAIAGSPDLRSASRSLQRRAIAGPRH